eukprot:4154932-Amphidinium_carterae.1
MKQRHFGLADFAKSYADKEPHAVQQNPLKPNRKMIGEIVPRKSKFSKRRARSANFNMHCFPSVSTLECVPAASIRA